jgi:hypothetical protein
MTRNEDLPPVQIVHTEYQLDPKTGSITARTFYYSDGTQETQPASRGASRKLIGVRFPHDVTTGSQNIIIGIRDDPVEIDQ